jgi:hypothetical protein
MKRHQGKPLAQLRGVLFRYLDGFPVAPTVVSLQRHSVLEMFAASQTLELGEIVRRCGGNEGYLQVALRLLCSQGWLVQTVDASSDTVRYTTTRHTSTAFEYAGAYADIVAFLPLAVRMDELLFGQLAIGDAPKLDTIVRRHLEGWGLPRTGDPDIDMVRKQILLHIEGMILGPALVSLGMRGLLERYDDDQRAISTRDFGGNQEAFFALLELFAHLGWMKGRGDAGQLTATGLFHLARASAYGVTVSYLPMFARVEELLFGDPAGLWNVAPGQPELHVDRAMNVWGSGAAHARYFKKIDEVVVALFNRPIEEQPRGVADMGCGNGAFLTHIFDVIWERTARGKMLAEHPLIIVASDLNQAALQATSETLQRADVWAKIVHGDIGDPHALAQHLRKEHGVELEDLLSVRSFLDHNRLYQEPASIDPGRESRSSGAFSFRGERIPNNAIEQNLVDHLRSWAPHVGRFGLLVLELHTIPPKMAALNIGRTNVTAYDGTHGYSDQYILELEVFLKAAREAGLSPVPEFQAKFPSSDLASISINLLRAAPTHNHPDDPGSLA